MEQKQHSLGNSSESGEDSTQPNSAAESRAAGPRKRLLSKSKAADEDKSRPGTKRRRADNSEGTDGEGDACDSDVDVGPDCNKYSIVRIG